MTALDFIDAVVLPAFDENDDIVSYDKEIGLIGEPSAIEVLAVDGTWLEITVAVKP